MLIRSYGISIPIPMLISLWQSSWDAPPDDIVAVTTGRGVRVPLGMGVAAPAYKIKEVLKNAELVEMRRTMKAAINARDAAIPD